MTNFFQRHPEHNYEPGFHMFRVCLKRFGRLSKQQIQVSYQPQKKNINSLLPRPKQQDETDRPSSSTQKTTKSSQLSTRISCKSRTGIILSFKRMCMATYRYPAWWDFSTPCCWFKENQDVCYNWSFVPQVTKTSHRVRRQRCRKIFNTFMWSVQTMRISWRPLQTYMWYT